MPGVFVAKVSQFADGERRVVRHGGYESGVFHWQGWFYAYENLCVHQGGPAKRNILGGNAMRLFKLKLPAQKLARVA
jgi:nitrite reductase/ring-hydroxylating ferredoxin subunit